VELLCARVEVEMREQALTCCVSLEPILPFCRSSKPSSLANTRSLSSRSEPCSPRWVVYVSLCQEGGSRGLRRMSHGRRWRPGCISERADTNCLLLSPPIFSPLSTFQLISSPFTSHLSSSGRGATGGGPRRQHDLQGAHALAGGVRGASARRARSGAELSLRTREGGEGALL
jgi:hypothetical protein